MQVRPCFLVIDSEHAGSISTRKLVLETAKYNVITCYSATEAASELRRFPRVDGVIMNAIMRDVGLTEFLQVLQDLPEVKLILVGDSSSNTIALDPDAAVESFAPDKLLKVLRELFPVEAKQLLEHEADLERREI